MLPILTELGHAVDMQMVLETCVEEGNFSKVHFGFFPISPARVCASSAYYFMVICG